MFAYCENNPINKADYGGNISTTNVMMYDGGGGLDIKINPYGLAGSSLSFPDAVTVWDLAGYSASLGGTLGALEYESLQSVGPSPTVHGNSVGIGAGLEFHFTITYSWLIPLN